VPEGHIAIHRALALPTRFADAFELDFAGTGYGEVLNQTYRGALAHYSIAPEPFLMEDVREVQSGIAGETLYPLLKSVRGISTLPNAAE